MPFAVEQIKGSAQTQERIINAYRETRGDLELATKLSLGNDGMTSTSTLYENYLDGFHSNHLESGEHSHLPSSSVPPSYCWMMIRFRLIGRGHLFLFPSLSLSLSLSLCISLFYFFFGLFCVLLRISLPIFLPICPSVCFLRLCPSDLVSIILVWRESPRLRLSFAHLRRHVFHRISLLEYHECFFLCVSLFPPSRMATDG